MTEGTTEKVLTLLEVISGDLDDCRVLLERGSNPREVLEFLALSLSNHSAYAENLRKVSL